MPFTRILCPVDLSIHSGNLLARAIALAEGPDARVTALHVLDLQRVQAVTLARRDVAVRTETEHALQHLVRDTRLAGYSPVATDAQIVEGSPAAVILGRVRREHFDLVVMGTHAPSRSVSGGFGSTLGRVLCATRVPVLAWPERLLVESGVRGGCGVAHVTVAIDFSDASMGAARLAADVARRLDVDLTLLHVAPSAGVNQHEPDDPHILRHRHSIDELACVADELAHKGSRPALAMREGIASQAIAEAGAERPGTLVVIGLRRGSWTAVPPGSMALRVLGAGRHPVLAVPVRPHRGRSIARCSTNQAAVPAGGA